MTALIASALGGGVLAFNLVSLEELYPRSANGANALSLSMLNPTQVQYVEIAPLAPVDVRNYGPRRKNAQPSHELGSSSVHHRLNGENLVATPVPAYLIETPSGSPPSREAFARKSEPAHEYWRPTIGASSVIERYQLYPHSHPSGVVADTAVDRIKESEQATEKATSTKISQRVPKSEKSQSTSKNTQPAVEQNVALSVKEANAVQCRDQNDSKCREPLKTLSKNCSIGTGLTPEGVCLRKNYRASTVIKR